MVVLNLKASKHFVNIMIPETRREKITSTAKHRPKVYRVLHPRDWTERAETSLRVRRLCAAVASQRTICDSTALAFPDTETKNSNTLLVLGLVIGEKCKSHQDVPGRWKEAANRISARRLLPRAQILSLRFMGWYATLENVRGHTYVLGGTWHH